MTDADLCPACLTELPADYSFDHVAIDLALSHQPQRFRAMGPAERTEVVVTGLARGRTLIALADRLGWPYNRLQQLLPDDHPHSQTVQRAVLEQRVRELWLQQLSDSAIAMHTGQNASAVGKIRKDLGLPSRFGPGGRRLAVAS